MTTLLFETIDCPWKAYLLGRAVTDGTISPTELKIPVTSPIIYKLCELIKIHVPSRIITINNSSSLSICTSLKNTTKGRLELLAGNAFKSHNDFKWDLLSGIIDGGGFIDFAKWECHVDGGKGSHITTYLYAHTTIPCSINGSVVAWCGTNMVDMFMKLYDNAKIVNPTTKREFTHAISGDDTLPVWKWKREVPEAVPPSKGRFSDSGYDLTLISHIKTKNDVYYYDTGLKVIPPIGYYFDLVGRSSISKSGWMLANNVGIIDCSYRGTIIVALVRTAGNVDTPEIKLPCRLVQLIPRRLVLMHNIEIEEVDETERNIGGFGSTN
jgi:dUTPase